MNTKMKNVLRKTKDIAYKAKGAAAKAYEGFDKITNSEIIKPGVFAAGATALGFTAAEAFQKAADSSCSAGQRIAAGLSGAFFLTLTAAGAKYAIESIPPKESKYTAVKVEEAEEELFQDNM